MLHDAVSMILEKGGLGYALFLASVYVLARVYERYEKLLNERDVALAALQALRVADAQKIAELHGLRVADLQKTSDTAWQANEKLVQAMTRNSSVMEEVRELLDGQTDPRRSKRDERD